MFAKLFLSMSTPPVNVPALTPLSTIPRFVSEKSLSWIVISAPPLAEIPWTVDGEVAKSEFRTISLSVLKDATRGCPEAAGVNATLSITEPCAFSNRSGSPPLEANVKLAMVTGTPAGVAVPTTLSTRPTDLPTVIDSPAPSIVSACTIAGSSVLREIVCGPAPAMLNLIKSWSAATFASTIA